MNKYLSMAPIYLKDPKQHIPPQLKMAYSQILRLLVQTTRSSLVLHEHIDLSNEPYS